MEYSKKDYYNFAIQCENCTEFFLFNKENFYYKNPQCGISGVCKSCYNIISSKLILQVDVSKIKLIKQKAQKIYLQRKKKQTI